MANFPDRLAFPGGGDTKSPHQDETMKRAALYARFSSDLQSDRSIDDQIAICRARARQDGFQVVASFEDRARSGASVFGRTGLAEMMDAAKIGAFDVLIVEALDRISRDQEDMAAIFKRLSFLGVQIVTVHEGRADAVQIGIRGIVSSLFLTDLAHKVRRGAAGNIREGKHAGGLAYGYRTTPGKPGEWVIEPSEAAIIRRIFGEYVAGARSREIITRLNAEHVSPPRGHYWQPGALTGSNNRHNGILGNEVYAGRLVWNRVRMIKDPDTGKRVSRPNPESEWHRSDAPHLLIVDPDIFDKASAIRLERGRAPAALRRRPKHMLSGLLRCGACGGGMSAKGEDRGGMRIICTQFHNAKTCSNNRTYYLREVEQALLAGLRTHLTDPAAIKLFLTAYHAERRRLAGESGAARASLDRKIAEASRRLERATAAMIASTAPVETFSAAISELNAELNRLRSERESLPAESQTTIALHPAAQAKYLAAVENLAQVIAGDGEAGEAAAAIRDLVETVTVIRTEPGAPVELDVRGKLGSLVGKPLFPEGFMSGVKLVAGEGLSTKIRNSLAKSINLSAYDATVSCVCDTKL